MTGHISLQENPQIIRGIRLQAAAARIRRPDRKDLVLIELAEGSEAAAVFTQNAFCAAPVQLAKKHINETPPRYLLINSGNANAGTGQAGYNAAIECCTAVASLMDCHVS
ncbi:MAG: bifunctional ornithine acetyltransferase/N-acetylglutamate synthase, partial [Thioalkalispiraceae bacterium]